LATTRAVVGRVGGAVTSGPRVPSTRVPVPPGVDVAGAEGDGIDAVAKVPLRPISVTAAAPTVDVDTAASRSRTAAALAGRCSGVFSSRPSSSASRAGGVPGRTDEARGAGCSTAFVRTSMGASPAKGGAPVQRWKSVAPRA
jgi:hypothetical protein